MMPVWNSIGKLSENNTNYNRFVTKKELNIKNLMMMWESKISCT